MNKVRHFSSGLMFSTNTFKYTFNIMVASLIISLAVQTVFTLLSSDGSHVFNPFDLLGIIFLQISVLEYLFSTEYIHYGKVVKVEDPKYTVYKLERRGIGSSSISNFLKYVIYKESKEPSGKKVLLDVDVSLLYTSIVKDKSSKMGEFFDTLSEESFKLRLTDKSRLVVKDSAYFLILLVLMRRHFVHDLFFKFTDETMMKTFVDQCSEFSELKLKEELALNVQYNAQEIFK